MDTSPSFSPADMAADAAKAAMLLKMLANEHRLLILCHLIAEGEMSVGELTAKIGLGQSALSQHLAKLRNQGLVAFRREAQTLFYRVSDDRAAKVLLVLHEIYCSGSTGGRSGNSRKAQPGRGRQEGLEGGRR